jgi:hypothetical protein
MVRLMMIKRKPHFLILKSHFQKQFLWILLGCSSNNIYIPLNNNFVLWFNFTILVTVCWLTTMTIVWDFLFLSSWLCFIGCPASYFLVHQMFASCVDYSLGGKLFSEPSLKACISYTYTWLFAGNEGM